MWKNKQKKTKIYNVQKRRNSFFQHNFYISIFHTSNFQKLWDEDTSLFTLILLIDDILPRSPE